MPFLSIEFGVFFLLFFPIYWLLWPLPRVQNVLLTLTGLGWLAYLHWGFALTVVIAALVTAALAFALTRSENPRTRKAWLVGGLVLLVANLAFFKYFDFFRPLLKEWLHEGVVDILMPLGVSYYTFQAISYLVSLYRRENVYLGWADTLLHLSFFPTITSGPIFRAGTVKSIDGINSGAAVQLLPPQPRKIVMPALAVSLIVLGIVKNWWLAGALADGWVDPVFENPLQYDGWAVLTAMYGYTVQLFLNFSGYSDLVIGMAMLLGFQMPFNFRMPLRAYNIRDFWDRWHISLSTWIRDYIYIPLGGSRKGFARTQLNLMLAMLLSGIWHGYGWNFLLWGFLHGAALVLLNIGDKIFGRREILAGNRFTRILGILITVNFVCMAFVVFRTSSLEDAGLMFQALFANSQGWGLPELGTLLVLLAMCAALAAYGLLAKLFGAMTAMFERLTVYAWPLPLLLLMILMMVLAPEGIPGFIYANF